MESQTSPGEQSTGSAPAIEAQSTAAEDGATARLTPLRRRRRSRGRPTLLEPGAREILLTAIGAGNRLPAAARIAGISPKTLSEWLRRGRGLDARAATPLHTQLVDDVELAQAQAESNALEMIRKAAARDWRAAAWFLENSHDDWRRRKALPPPEPEPAQQPVAVAHKAETVIVLTPEDIREIARKRVAAKRGDDDDIDASRAALAPFIVDDSGPDA